MGRPSTARALLAAALAGLAAGAPTFRAIKAGYGTRSPVELQDGDSLCPSAGLYAADGFSVVCDAFDEAPASVSFAVNGSPRRTEYYPPYTLNGDRADTDFVRPWDDYPVNALIACNSNLGEGASIAVTFQCADPATSAPPPATTTAAAPASSAADPATTTVAAPATTTAAPATTTAGDDAVTSGATTGAATTTAVGVATSSAPASSASSGATSVPVSSGATTTVAATTIVAGSTSGASSAASATTTGAATTGAVNATTTAAAATASSSVVPASTVQLGDLTEVFIDAGSSDDSSYLSGESFAFGPTTEAIMDSTNDIAYQTHRYGKNFTYTLPMQAGSYAVTLGFAENSMANCDDGKRVFSVLVNGIEQPDLESIDVYETTGACNNALFRSIDVDVIPLTGSLTIQFVAITQNAFVSTIQVSPSGYQCIPESTNGFDSMDHRAHSVPGEYPPVNSGSTSYIDSDGDGFEAVELNGYKSHSHFQDTSDPNNPLAGQIRKWIWTNAETNEVMSEEAVFTHDFPLGTTRVILMVVDNTCDKATAETSVTVTGSSLTGKSYCYYYNSTDWPAVTDKQKAKEIDNKPFYAAERDGFYGSLPIPPGYDDEPFSAKCDFFYETVSASEITDVAVLVDPASSARVFKGSKILLDSETSTSGPTSLPAGLHGFSVTYVREEATGTPTLGLEVNDTAIAASAMSFDRSTVQPILTSIEPLTVPLGQQTSVVVRGYGFFVPLTVEFSGEGNVQSVYDSPNSFYVTTPSVDSAGAVAVSAATPQGEVSNELELIFGEVSVDPIKFTTSTVTNADGGTTNNLVSTCIAVWGDSWYMGTIGGRVVKLEVDPDYVVLSQCETEKFDDPNIVDSNGVTTQADILGITFAPADTVGKPYITVQSLFWHDRNLVALDDETAWRNGRILRLQPGGTCLVLDEIVVTGLAISDHDHGANGMDFDQDGNLYMALGGFTNAGLPGAGLGNQWDPPLAAAILRFKLGPGFNGALTYSQDLPNIQETVLTGGDVEVVATGLRNTFDITFTSKQEMYATDNSLNAGFGNISVSCDVSDPGVPAFNRADKVMKIVEGGYYGTPHLGRGECQYIDPYSGRDVFGNLPEAELNYVAPLKTLPSSIDGIIEYTASHFGGQLKNELIVSSFAPGSSGPTFRVRTDGQTQKLDDAITGLTVAQGFFGDLIFPRVKALDYKVLVPDYPTPAGLSARVVTPFRGGKDGGKMITITGHNFGENPTVTVDGQPCPLTGFGSQEFSKGSMLRCTTPPAQPGAELVDVAVTAGGATSVISDGFMYSRV